MDAIIVTSGEKWVGYGFRSFSSVIEEIMHNAQRKIVMTAYIISDIKIIKNLKEPLSKGVSVEIFIYHPESSPSSIIDEIYEMKRYYANLRVDIIRDEILHAKVIIVDESMVLLGSANPTLSGMVKNYELGLFFRDGEIAQRILDLLRRLN